jgi:hypothetical protein
VRQVRVWFVQWCYSCCYFCWWCCCPTFSCAVCVLCSSQPLSHIGAALYPLATAVMVPVGTAACLPFGQTRLQWTPPRYPEARRSVTPHPDGWQCARRWTARWIVRHLAPSPTPTCVHTAVCGLTAPPPTHSTSCCRRSALCSRVPSQSYYANTVVGSRRLRTHCPLACVARGSMHVCMRFALAPPTCAARAAAWCTCCCLRRCAAAEQGPCVQRAAAAGGCHGQRCCAGGNTRFVLMHDPLLMCGSCILARACASPYVCL